MWISYTANYRDYIRPWPAYILYDRATASIAAIRFMDARRINNMVFEYVNR